MPSAKQKTFNRTRKNKVTPKAPAKLPTPDKVDCEGNRIKLKKEDRYIPAIAGRKAWIAPVDMPDWLVKDVIAGKRCGGKTRGKDSKKYCQSTHVLPNAVGRAPFRCRFHGGCSTGVKDPDKHPKPTLSHGIYSNSLTDEEKELLTKGEVKVGTLEAEVQAQKIRLRRALKAEHEWQQSISEGDDGTDHGYVESITAKKSRKEDGYEDSTTIDKVIPKFTQIIDTILRTLVRLENQHRELTGGNAMSDEERARKIQQFLKEAEQSVMGG